MLINQKQNSQFIFQNKRSQVKLKTQDGKNVTSFCWVIYQCNEYFIIIVKLQLQYQTIIQIKGMSQIYVDPLRFLKPRKKQSQLTPKKYTNQSNLSLFACSKKQPKNQVSLIKNTNIQNGKTPSNLGDVEKNVLLKGKNSKYDPLKYFCKDIEMHLYQLHLKNNTYIQNQSKDRQDSQNRKEALQFIDDSFRLQPNLIIPLQKVNDHNETLNLQDYFSNSKQTPRTFNQPYHSMAMIGQSPIQPKQQTHFSDVHNLQNKLENYFPEKLNNKSLQQELQLRSCLTCKRKFNLNSYKKHVKVCQKVFFKKRTQFSSEKQRSLSKQRKK